MEVSNLLDPLKSGVEDFRISSISEITFRSQGGAVVPMGILVPVPLGPLMSLETGVEYFSHSTMSWIVNWDGYVNTSPTNSPRDVLLVHALPEVSSAKLSITAGVRSICVVSIIVRFVSRGNTETSLMFQQLNNVLSKILLLV